MAKKTVGVDVTAHKEERNVADTRKKARLRARYYVELVVGSRHASHTRLGFSGSFKALLSLHHAFVQVYQDVHMERTQRSASVSSASHRQSMSSSSSATSQSSVTSASRSSPSSIKRLLKQAFRFNSAKSDGAPSAHNSLDQLHHLSWSTPGNALGLPPFPAQNKVLVRLEGGAARDDAKIEARTAALFEYYSTLFNSEDGELFVDLIHQQALLAAERKQTSSVGATPEDGERSGLFKRLLNRQDPSRSSIVGNSDLEFLDPVHVRGPSKSRGHRSTKRSSVSADARPSSNQLAH